MGGEPPTSPANSLRKSGMSPPAMPQERQSVGSPPMPASREDKKDPPKTEEKKARKPERAPKSAPAELQRPAPTSAQKRSWFGIRDRITKLLNPDATTADLGEGMQAYYDEKRKVWVFPGENPDEVAKPIGAPPTMTPKKEEAPKPAAPSNDPLAAMMAPPPRSVGRPAGGARLTPGAGLPGAGFPGMMMMPPGARTPSTPATPGGSGPPKFMVFTPKGDDTKEKKEEK